MKQKFQTLCTVAAMACYCSVAVQAYSSQPAATKAESPLSYVYDLNQIRNDIMNSEDIDVDFTLDGTVITEYPYVDPGLEALFTIEYADGTFSFSSKNVFLGDGNRSPGLYVMKNGNTLFVEHGGPISDCILPPNSPWYWQNASYTTDKLARGIYNIVILYDGFRNSQRVAFLQDVELHEGYKLIFSGNVYSNHKTLASGYEWAYAAKGESPIFLRLGDKPIIDVQGVEYQEVLLSPTGEFAGEETAIAHMREDYDKIYTKPISCTLPAGFWYAGDKAVNPMDCYGVGEFVAYDFGPGHYNKEFMQKEPSNYSFRLLQLKHEQLPIYSGNGFYRRVFDNGMEWALGLGAVGFGSNLLPYPSVNVDKEDTTARKLMYKKDLSDNRFVYKNSSLYDEYMSSVTSTMESAISLSVEGSAVIASAPGKFSVEVINVAGIRLASLSGENSATLDISACGHGVFVAILRTADGEKTLRFIR